MEMQDLYLQGGQARARTRRLTVANDPEDWYDLGKSRTWRWAIWM